MKKPRLLPALLALAVAGCATPPLSGPAPAAEPPRIERKVPLRETARWIQDVLGAGAEDVVGTASSLFDAIDRYVRGEESSTAG
jgi:hypothetical protein